VDARAFLRDRVGAFETYEAENRKDAGDEWK